MSLFERVYEYVKTVPRGKVVTYGQVAAAIGAPPSRASFPVTASSTARGGSRPRSRSAAKRCRQASWRRRAWKSSADTSI